MDFLGVGPGELFLILVVMLLVLGPERLPQFARGAGRLIVRVREWIQRSPDAQLVLRARDELEQELEEIRRSFNEEVQTVRAELESVRGDLAEATRALEESTAEASRALEQSAAQATRAVEETAAQAVEQLNDTLPSAMPSIAPPADAIAEPAPQLDLPGTLAETITDEAQEFAVDPGPIGARLRAVREREAAEQATLAETAAESPAAELPVNGQPVPRSAKPGWPTPTPVPAPEDSTITALERRIQALGEEFARQINTLMIEIQTLRDQRQTAEAPADADGRVQEEVV
jgi:sec-independent protein translocase protein TatB